MPEIQHPLLIVTGKGKLLLHPFQFSPDAADSGEVCGIVHLRFKYVIVRVEYGDIFVVDLRVMRDKGLHQQRKHPVCQNTGYCASRARVHDVHLEVDQHHVHGLLQLHAVRDLQQGQQTFRTCGHFSF